MITNIIFSKDRAAQLHLLLESIEKNSAGIFNDIRVIFAASSDAFEEGYDGVMAEFAGKMPIKFIPEGCYSNFKIAVEDSVYQVNTAFTCFMVDDNILYRPIASRDDLYGYIDKNVGMHRQAACFSLRLGQNCIVQDYHRGEMATLPRDIEYEKNYLDSWNNSFMKWDTKQVSPYSNFGYRLSVDGHIMCTTLARQLAVDYDYHQPNSMEGAWTAEKKIPEGMASYTTSVLINSPTNRVQDYAKNLAGQHFGITAERLNQMYLSGKRIDLDAIDFTCIQGCHQELEMKFK